MTSRFDRTAMIAAACTLAISLTACSTPTPLARELAADSTRRIDQGALTGHVGIYGSHVWRGIPYAKPPVGALRWRAPQRPGAWSGSREARVQGNFCPQYASPLGGVEGRRGEVLGSEDCLYLDIYAPRVAADSVANGDGRHPVMVWIHGGSNVIGHGGLYNGGRLAQEHDVVVVTINYRLGSLGWFRHSALSDDNASAVDRSGNYGTLDMIRALEWVRDNIGSFGGDSQNVTIFGESAGGTDVFSLLVSPLAKGLFHRAISQSGGTYFIPPSQGENFADDAEPGEAGSSNEVILMLLQADGSASDRAHAREQLSKMSANEVAQYLRSKSPSDLFRVYERDDTEDLVEIPRLFREGTVIPVEPAIDLLARSDGWNVVPVIAGTNRDEMKVFMYGDKRWVARWLGLIPRFRDAEGFQVRAKYQTQMWKATGSDEPASAMRSVSPNVWSYRFDWDEEPSILGADLSSMLGAAHGFEIPFVFGHYDLGEAAKILFTEDNLPGREELAGRMMSYWTQFAKTGNPGRGRNGELLEWEPWGTQDGEPRFVLLDTDAGGGIRMSPANVTQQSVLDAALADPRVAHADDRCEILNTVTAWAEISAPDDCLGD